MTSQPAMKIVALPLLFLAAVLFAGGCKQEESPIDPAPTPVGASEIEPNDNVPNELGTLGTAAVVVNGTTSGNSDIDLFVITIAAGTNLNATLSWTGTSDLDLGLLDARGIALNYQHTASNPERCTLPNREAGRYMIEVTSSTAGSTSYTLTVSAR